MRFKYFVFFIVLIFVSQCTLTPVAKAQSFELTSYKKRVTIPFRLVRSMIVVELMINGKGPFNFILDTGVGLMIISDPTLIDSINISHKRSVQLFGLGEGDAFEAYVVSTLKVTLPDIESNGVGAVIFKEDHFGLSNYAGMDIHGLLGYEFFNNLAVEINFMKKMLTVWRPKDLKTRRRGDKIPITIDNKKPYLEADLILPDGTHKKSKVVIDIGAGHALSLENYDDVNNSFPKLTMANLGMGFTGPISGYISRIDKIQLGKYKFRKVITAFPTLNAFKRETFLTKRDGNLGLGILKKFTITLNYHDHVMYLKPAQRFAEPFEHDMSGIEYFSGGEDFKHLIIHRVEPSSAGDLAGLMKDDEILSINLKPVSQMMLDEIDDIFKSRDKRTILLEVLRKKKYLNIFLSLKRRI